MKGMTSFVRRLRYRTANSLSEQDISSIVSPRPGEETRDPQATLLFDTMSLPYKIATLLYCFNESDEVLLMERAQEPNLGLWSPCGGTLHTDEGESPYACACREAEEELGMVISIPDLHLTGIISECGYEGKSHWLLFLFEVKRKLERVPREHREGRFAFFSREAL